MTTFILSDEEASLTAMALRDKAAGDEEHALSCETSADPGVRSLGLQFRHQVTMARTVADYLENGERIG